MADAWGRITGQLGVSMYTSPGFANAIPGLVNALHSEAPLLSIAGSADLAELGRGAMQETDQVGMAAPVTKGSFMVHDARRIPDYVARAVRLAFSGRRGPVHLTIPMDVQEQEVEEGQAVFYDPNEYRPSETGMAQPELVRQALDLLRRAKRPMAIAGDAAGYGLSGDSLRRFVEDHPRAGLDRGPGKGTDFRRASPVLRILRDRPQLGRQETSRCRPGAAPGAKAGTNTIGFCRPPNVAADARIIQVDPSAAEIGRNRGVAVGMVGDVAAVLRQMAEEAAAYSWEEGPWIDELRAVQAAQAEWSGALAKPDRPMHAMFVHKTVESLLRPDDSVVFDGGDFCHFGRSVLPARLPARWYYVSTLGMLGSALPTAMAAKLARPDSRVVTFVGDGAFGFKRHGARHGGAPRSGHRDCGGQRRCLGNRPADTAGIVRPPGGPPTCSPAATTWWPRVWGLTANWWKGRKT